MIAIYLKDVLSPVQADEDFVGAINTINMSAAKGLSFIIMDDPTGGHVGFNIANINMIEEVDD